MKNLFKHILVAVDFAPASKEAFRFASELAVREEASLTILHVYPLPGIAYPDGFLPASPDTFLKLMDTIDNGLSALQYEAEKNGVRAVKCRAVEGAPEAKIIEIASAGKHDLIVIGTHGRTGLKHMLLGSVAEGVVRRAPCPVLTVRSKA